MIDLPPHFLLSRFILGLKPHLRREVQALQPITLMQTIHLEKIQEEKYSELWKYQTFPTTYNSNYQPPAVPCTTSQSGPQRSPISHSQTFDLKVYLLLNNKKYGTRLFAIPVTKSSFWVTSAKADSFYWYIKR